MGSQLDAKRIVRVISNAIVLATFFGVLIAGCGDSSRSATSSPDQASQTASSQGAADCRHEAKAFHCVKFVKNYDADTITVDIPGVHPLIGDRVSVRVSGVDAPEIKGKNECEKQSARIARNLVEHVLEQGKRIDLVNVGRDKYFRILADVIVDGRSIKDILMKNGLAYEYHGETKKKVDWCSVARGEARVPAGEDSGEARPVARPAASPVRKGKRSRD